MEVHEFVLSVREQESRAPIDADQVEAKARQLRHDRVSDAISTFASLPDATLIDTSLQRPQQVAEAVMSRLR